jgi:1-acyl-sn-glycerol-3-phosphate acyltransferase
VRKEKIHFTNVEKYILAPLCPVAKPLFRALFGIKFYGLENVPEGACIVASNHRSHLDPPVLNSVFPQPLVFLAKEELFRPPLGWIIKHMRALPVRRNGDLEVLKKALDLLKKGLKVAIFPEGTRARPGEFLRPKPGVGILAIRSGCPVLPVLIEGTDRSFPRGAKFPKPFGSIKVVIGKPMSFEGFEDSPAGYRIVAREVMAKIQELSSSSFISL